MEKQLILIKNGPKPKGPYSQAIRAGSLLFVSGQVSIDPKTGALLAGDIQTETERALENLKLVLEDAGSSLDDVVSVTIYLREMGQFAAMNEVYRRYFPNDPPTRTCVGISDLIGGLQIELNAIASICT